ncbi:hypothetical protein B0J18DRAFT_422178 [Chaetomium sp. MPI-SDFR-AT-0129]|nr:hypothetical protein B0J18DRAFT_422178 [Chaetomium sp. MPI-SDFR-AT-0129]
MYITPLEARDLALSTSDGHTARLRSLVTKLAQREGTSAADILIGLRDDFNQTLAHTACKAGQIASIQTLADLLHTRANKTLFFNLSNRFTGDRPVHTAMRLGYVSVLKVLVTHGADPTATNRFGDTVEDYLGDFEEGEVRGVVEGYLRGLTGGS